MLNKPGQSKFDAEREIRRKPCNPFDFNCKLYEVLWVRAEGYESAAEIAHELYKRYEVCAVYFARQDGYETFEEMLHSDKLKHVVTVERIPFKPSYAIFHYRATLNNDNYVFAAIRKRLLQRKPSYTNGLYQDLNRRLAGLPSEAELKRTTESIATKERKYKEIRGEIFSYKVEIGSDDEGMDGKGEFAFEDGDGWEEWAEEEGEDGDSSGGSVIAAGNDAGGVEKAAHSMAKAKLLSSGSNPKGMKKLLNTEWMTEDDNYNFDRYA
uniref:DUF7515 domain-containing protein n=1 Tax=Globodera rostochiensis TaxID=31243 RepID=A0A914I0F8_GLORO